MILSDYDYELPQELIAQEPSSRRECSRLMFLDRANGQINHFSFHQVLELLCSGDVLVLNNTKVLPARLSGHRHTGGKFDILLVQCVEGSVWQALVKTRGRLQPGETMIFEGGYLTAELVERHPEEGWLIKLNRSEEDVREQLTLEGRMPLPPYIKRKKEHDSRSEIDRERYQTVFASEPGAIAAPTAGLHFTNSLLKQAESKGVQVVFVTLHVGIGTFKPVKEMDPRNHTMHAEYYIVSEETVKIINTAKEENRRIIAVGTTTCRTLEACSTDRILKSGSGWTDIYIYPPYKFKTVNSLITNFHLPQSTLLMLVSAFVGHEQMINAYQTAIEMKYRFYSYGDAMMIG